MDERTRLVALFEAERESHGASDEPYHVGYWEALGWAIEELGYSA